MGSLTRQNAGKRLHDAVQQQIDECDSESDLEHLVWTLTTKLEMRAFDAEEIHHTAHEIALDPDKIHFPDGYEYNP